MTAGWVGGGGWVVMLLLLFHFQGVLASCVSIVVMLNKYISLVVIVIH